MNKNNKNRLQALYYYFYECFGLKSSDSTLYATLLHISHYDLKPHFFYYYIYPKRGRQSKQSLNENGAVSFNSKDNAKMWVLLKFSKFTAAETSRYKK